MSGRAAATDCRREPPYPGASTVVCSLAYPEMTCHLPHAECGIQEPHGIAECGRFAQPQMSPLLQDSPRAR